MALMLIAGVVVVHRAPLWVADQKVRFSLWRSGVQSKYVGVDGNRIHYFEAMPRGGTEGVPLVLLHGLGAHGEDWGPLIPGLAAVGFHVYVPDLLGFGRSDRPDVSYSISMQEKLVADFMRAVHIQPADIAGWSMGGWVAMKLAVDDPVMVDRLVLFDAAGIYFPAYTQLETIFDVRDVAGVHRLFALMTPDARPLPDFVARDLVRRIRKNYWVISRSMSAMTTGRDLMDFRLAVIRQPTLVVWGNRDALIPLSSGEKIHQGIRGSSLLVLNGCDHLAPAQCPDASQQALVAFLEAQPPLVGVERTVEGRR